MPRVMTKGGTRNRVMTRPFINPAKHRTTMGTIKTAGMTTDIGRPYRCSPAASTPALALAGFSFGSFVVSQAVQRLWASRTIEKLVLVGVAASRFEVAPIPPELHLQTLVLHGEKDDTVPLADVLDWARPQALPVLVAPGVEHFFHGQLPLLKNLVLRHLSH